MFSTQGTKSINFQLHLTKKKLSTEALMERIRQVVLEQRGFEYGRNTSNFEFTCNEDYTSSVPSQIFPVRNIFILEAG